MTIMLSIYAALMTAWVVMAHRENMRLHDEIDEVYTRCQRVLLEINKAHAQYQRAWSEANPDGESRGEQ